MYASQPSFVLGFHGCDRTVAEDILAGSKDLRHSKNDYDWLGHGTYFWENDPDRAMLFAKQCIHRKNSKVKEPAVLGAVIDLGYCLNLLESGNLQLLKFGYDMLVAASESFEAPLPRNSEDSLFRHLDCAVIETVHQSREEADKQAFDSVRGVFWEGNELYPSAGFREKNHIQICVRNLNCIKGFFRVRRQNNSWPLP